jgi:hypothetical protein
MDERTVTPQIRTFFWGVGTVFAGIAGLLLFLFPERSDSLFAWTIVRGDTAAFIGACLLCIALVSLLCRGNASWAAVRVCFVGVLVFVTTMTVTTLLHLDQINFGSDEPVALVMAWAWTLVYLAAPVASIVLLLRQLREPGTDEAPTTPIVPGLRYLYLAQGALLAIVAVVLFVSPGTADSLWPWPLTPLPARAIASFLLGIGIMLLGIGWENAAERLEPPGAACWWLAVLIGMAVTRFNDSVDVGTVPGLVFALTVVSLLFGGVAGEMAARRLRSAEPGAAGPPRPPRPPRPAGPSG